MSSVRPASIEVLLIERAKGRSCSIYMIPLLFLFFAIIHLAIRINTSVYLVLARHDMEMVAFHLEEYS